MKLYKRKVTVVEAEQFFPSSVPWGVQVQKGDYHAWDAADRWDRYYVVTAHGQRVYLEPGDWVIAEPDGRGYYPVKPDIFASMYEPAISEERSK